MNLAEILSKLLDHGLGAGTLDGVRTGLPLGVETFTAAYAALVGALRASTRTSGLSLGDRCCIALDPQADAEVVTADKAWKSSKGFRVNLIR